MEERDNESREDIYSKVLRAGRRTYFLDVRATRSDDYYLTVTESKKFTNEDGSSYYKKHKIYLYKEDFENFKEMLDDVTEYIFKKKGKDIIHNSDEDGLEEATKRFSDVQYEDI